MWVLDWDHRIPSRDCHLRLYAFYSSQGKAIGELSFADRSAQIETGGSLPGIRRVGFRRPGGRRGLRGRRAGRRRAETVSPGQRVAARNRRPRRRARPSRSRARPTTFKEVASETRARPPGLGDLEAAEWCPPSESGHGRWGVDVWYLAPSTAWWARAPRFSSIWKTRRSFASATSSSAPDNPPRAADMAARCGFCATATSFFQETKDGLG
jgi:hypothetical protein